MVGPDIETFCLHKTGEVVEIIPAGWFIGRDSHRHAADFDTPVVALDDPLFANDAVIMPNNGNAAIGEDAIREGFQNLFDGNLNISFDIQEITVLGDFAIAWSENSGSRSTDVESGEEIPFNSKSFFFLKKGDDNSWKIFRYMFNESPTDSL